MIERKTKLDRLELGADGTISIRMALILAEGDEVLSSQFHRVAVGAEEDIAQAMAAVMAHIGTAGYPSLQDAELQLVQGQHALIKSYLLGA